MNRPSEKQTFVQKYLDPSERLGEILFGLIMVLTFTLTAGFTVEDGPGAARELLLAALGCNIAWGIIDGGMFIMGSMMGRARQANTLRTVQKAASDSEAFRIIDQKLDDSLVAYAEPQERQRLIEGLLPIVHRAELKPVGVTRDDVMGAIACFWLVVISCFPVALPFFFIDQVTVAMRVSNALLVAMLFVIGYRWGRFANTSRWGAGLVFFVLGLILVGIAIVLGG